MCVGDRHNAARHSGKEQRRRVRNFDLHQPALVLLRSVAFETRPVLRARNQCLQAAHHLAAVANTERECVATAEKLDEHFSESRAVQDGLGPASAGTEHVSV